MSAEALGTGCAAFILALFSSIGVGLGWATLNSNDVCTDEMHTFIKAFSIVASVQLAFFLLGVLLSITSLCSSFMEGVSTFYNGIIIIFVPIVGSILHSVN
jgi:hypothetical protein